MRHDRAMPLNANRIGSNPAPRNMVGDIVQGYELSVGYKHSFPSVDLVPSNGDTYGGRYFPKYNAILVYHNEHDVDLTRATVIHEGAHWKRYCVVCNSPKGGSSCGYRGDHDAGFYEAVGPFYKAFGVEPQIIQIVERGYRYPKSLLRRK